MDRNLMHGFSGPPKSTPQYGISISSVIFAELTTVTDKLTDR